MIMWWGTSIEGTSAIARRLRDGSLSASDSRRAQRILEALFLRPDQVVPSEELRLRAGRLLYSHPLRAADAFQLSAALQWCDGHSAGLEFVCFDNRLRDAAQREGFVVLPSSQAMTS